MSSGGLSEQLESTLSGIIEFVLRYLRSTRDLLIRPSRLTEAAHRNFSDGRYLAPNAFLLTCALTFGFFGKLLASGNINLNASRLEQVKDISLSSFLSHSVPVFLIAVVTAFLSGLLLHKEDENSVRLFRQLNYYVIGFFGLGGIVVLLLLSGLLEIVFEAFQFEAFQYFRLVALLTLFGYVAGMLALLYRLSAGAFQGDELPALATRARLRVVLCNIIVISLCVLNFVRPIFQQDSVLDGQMIDIHETADNHLRFTFLLTNNGDGAAVINQVDEVILTARSGTGNGERGLGKLCRFETKGQSTAPFLLLEPKNSALLTFCTRSPDLNRFLKRYGYAGTSREGSTYRLQQSGSVKLRFIATLKVPASDRERPEVDIRLDD